MYILSKNKQFSVGFLDILQLKYPTYRVELLDIDTEFKNVPQDIHLLIIDCDGMDINELKIKIEYLSKSGYTICLLSRTSYIKKIIVRINFSHIKGFIVKESSIQIIYNAILRLLDNQTFFSQEVITLMLERPAVQLQPKVEKKQLPAELTLKEWEIIQLLCSGASNSHIAKVLFISESTVNVYISRLVKKFGTKNKVNLIILAFNDGWV